MYRVLSRVQVQDDRDKAEEERHDKGKKAVRSPQGVFESKPAQHRRCVDVLWNDVGESGEAVRQTGK